MNKNVFVPSGDIKSVNWLVERLLALGHVNLFVAQPGIGKSFLVEDLAVSVAYNKPFLGLPTQHGDVVLIDEDTPIDTLQERLKKFSASCPPKGRNTLFVHSKEGHSLKSIEQLIESYPKAVLVIIDCLVALSDNLNLDNTADASKAGQSMQKIKADNRTVIFIHHISAKYNLAPDELMSHPNPQGLSMNNTRLVSACDTLYLGASPDTDGILRTLYLRTKSRRRTIPLSSFVTNLHDNKKAMFFEFGKSIDLRTSLDRDQSRVLEIFEVGQEFSIQNMVTDSAQYLDAAKARKIATELESKGYYEYLGKKGKGGKMYYRRIK